MAPSRVRRWIDVKSLEEHSRFTSKLLGIILLAWIVRLVTDHALDQTAMATRVWNAIHTNGSVVLALFLFVAFLLEGLLQFILIARKVGSEIIDALRGNGAAAISI